MSSTDAPAPSSRSGLARTAAGIVGAQAVVLLAFALVFAVKSLHGENDGRGEVVAFIALLVLSAAGLGLVARALWRRRSWPRTATMVWEVLLVPVAVSLIQSGWLVLGVLVLFAALVAIAAVLLSRPAEASG